MKSAPTSPQAISIGPNRLRGRRRIQYTPVSAGPTTRTAFWAASHAG